MAIYKCADEACTTVYEFQRVHAGPLGERVRRLLEVSNSNDIDGIGDAFIALVQPTRLVIDGGVAPPDRSNPFFDRKRE